MEKVKEVLAKVELFLILKLKMKPSQAKAAMVAVPALALLVAYHFVAKLIGG